jgi:hypothetical protein
MTTRKTRPWALAEQPSCEGCETCQPATTTRTVKTRPWAFAVETTEATEER